MKSLEKLYRVLPNYAQNILVTVYNINAYRKRHGGKYRFYRKLFKANRNLSLSELQEIQFSELRKLLNHANNNSSFYKNTYKNINIHSFKAVKDIEKLPIVSKETIRANINKAITAPKSMLSKSKTGGTTGKSLVVFNKPENIQERMAMLDNFRAGFGYELGKRTAWFSGKAILSAADIKKNRFWKTDYWHKVRYYSSFHIQEKNLGYYVENIIKFAPEFLVGFPSTINDIAEYGIRHKIDFPENTVKAAFPTAETLTPKIRENIEGFFKTKVYDQYASSEGAPFIFECKNGNLHLELQSGIFEVLDENDKPTNSGRLVVTSFTTYGTPLIRYDIGDTLTLSDKTCTCGNNNPIAESLQGRVVDHIFSPDTGKINLGNISNATKGVKGIIKFQVIQEELHKVKVKVVKDPQTYIQSSETTFLKNLCDRLGYSMQIELDYVSEIANETSGKFRIVKNLLTKQ